MTIVISDKKEVFGILFDQYLTTCSTKFFDEWLKETYDLTIPHCFGISITNTGEIQDWYAEKSFLFESEEHYFAFLLKWS